VSKPADFKKEKYELCPKRQISSRSAALILARPFQGRGDEAFSFSGVASATIEILSEDLFLVHRVATRLQAFEWLM
jgi:hypothetical protein